MYFFVKFLPIATHHILHESISSSYSPPLIYHYYITCLFIHYIDNFLPNIYPEIITTIHRHQRYDIYFKKSLFRRHLFNDKVQSIRYKLVFHFIAILEFVCHRTAFIDISYLDVLVILFIKVCLNKIIYYGRTLF